MKGIKLLTILLCIFLLTGCTAAGTSEGTETEDGNENKNLARIAELEAELQKVREENYINESKLEAEIKELKAKIAVLTGASEDNGTEGNMIFHYTVENGAATVTGYEGTHALVRIPDSLDGYPVKRIGERAFEGNTTLAAVIVPAGVEVIGWFAFYDCRSLIEITLPASVTDIGHAVFDGCGNVTVVCEAGSYAESYAKSYGIACRGN